MAPRAKRPRAAEDLAEAADAGAPSPVSVDISFDAASGPPDTIPQPGARRGRPRLSRVESAAAAADGSAAGSDVAGVNAERGRLITDLRQNSIENLRVEHRRLKEATKNAQRDMRNAKRRRNRILAKIRNLDAESVLSVLIDRGLADPHSASAAASSDSSAAAAPLARPVVPEERPALEDVAADGDSEHESTEAEPSVGAPAVDEDLNLEALVSAQPSETSAASAGATEQQPPRPTAAQIVREAATEEII
jgi:hypothetical protein